MKFPDDSCKNSMSNTLQVERAADVLTSKLSLRTARKLHLRCESLVSHWLTIFEILSLGYRKSKVFSGCCTSAPPASPLSHFHSFLERAPLLVSAQSFPKGKNQQK